MLQDFLRTTSSPRTHTRFTSLGTIDQTKETVLAALSAGVKASRRTIDGQGVMDRLSFVICESRWNGSGD